MEEAMDLRGSKPLTVSIISHGIKIDAVIWLPKEAGLNRAMRRQLEVDVKEAGREMVRRERPEDIERIMRETISGFLYEDLPNYRDQKYMISVKVNSAAN